MLGCWGRQRLALVGGRQRLALVGGRQRLALVGGRQRLALVGRLLVAKEPPCWPLSKRRVRRAEVVATRGLDPSADKRFGRHCMHDVHDDDDNNDRNDEKVLVHDHAQPLHWDVQSRIW